MVPSGRTGALSTYGAGAPAAQRSPIGRASADALFANYAARDYRLKAGSPAIDKGRNIQPIGTDIRGKPRKIGVNVDIGAYEYDPVAN